MHPKELVNDDRAVCATSLLYLHLYLTWWEFCRNPICRWYPPVKDSGQGCIHHRTPKSGAYSVEILFPWQMIYFIYFPWSSRIISILLIHGKYIKKVINWQLWLCYGPQTAIIHYVSIINFTSIVFQQRLQKEGKKSRWSPVPWFLETRASPWLDISLIYLLSQGWRNQNNNQTKTNKKTHFLPI